MSATDVCRQPPGFDELLAYWFGELDEARSDAIDEHLLGCEACGARLDEIVALGEGVRRAFDEGWVGVVTGQPFAQRLAGRGLRVREHAVALNGSVSCTIAPDDDVLVARLRAPLQGVERLDLLRSSESGERRSADIPFDAASGEVVLVAPAARVKQMSSGVEWMRLVAVEASGDERELGRYRFDHTAWRG